MAEKKINLQELRKEIDSIDDEITKLLDKRFDTVKVVGELKKEQKINVEDKNRDQVVLENRDSSKYSPHVKEIYSKIIEESKKLQNKNNSISLNLKKPKVGVIGFGSFGEYLVKNISNNCEVFVFDNVDKSKEVKKVGGSFVSLKELVQKSKYIILSVPMRKLSETIDLILPLLKKDQVVLDVCSLKIFSCKLMKEKLPSCVEIVGTHPLFGPAAKEVRGQKIAICPVCAKKETIEKIKSFCEEMGLAVFLTTPEEHDRQMAYSQALTHMIGKSLIDSNINKVPLSTRTFNLVMEVTDVIRNDSKELFEDMQTLNPYAKEVRKKFIKSCEKIDSSIND